MYRVYGIDYDKLTAQLTGDAQQIAKIWTDTGLGASDASDASGQLRWPRAAPRGTTLIPLSGAAP